MRRRRKNFLITFVLIIILWLVFVLQILFIEPVSIKDFLIPNIYLLFFLNLFLALFFTLAVIFVSSSKGLLFSLAITTFLFLRILGLGNWFNLLLIIAIAFILNRYIYQLDQV